MRHMIPWGLVVYFIASGHVSRMTTLKLLGILRLCSGNPSTTASAWTAYGGRCGLPCGGAGHVEGRCPVGGTVND